MGRAGGTEQRVSGTNDGSFFDRTHPGERVWCMERRIASRTRIVMDKAAVGHLCFHLPESNEIAFQFRQRLEADCGEAIQGVLIGKIDVGHGVIGFSEKRTAQPRILKPSALISLFFPGL